MKNRGLRIAVAGIALCCTLGAAAQTAPPTESVTVTGTRASQQAVEGFVAANTAPTRMAGKITRWKDGICPKAIGLPKKFADFVAQHVRDVAKQVGAPVDASAVRTTGSRLGDGIRSALYHVLIVANPDKLVDYEIGALADHIAMLALSQQAPQEGCQPLPSILDLLSRACAPVKAMTGGDIAYLSALYKMGAADTLQMQRDEMASQMTKALGGP